MIRTGLKNAGEWVEDRLRHLCGRITPDRRVAVIVVMFLLFSGMSLWFTVSSIYRFGKGDGEKLRIEHIEMLELELQRKQSQLDSLKQFNEINYDFERERETE